MVDTQPRTGQKANASLPSLLGTLEGPEARGPGKPLFDLQGPKQTGGWDEVQGGDVRHKTQKVQLAHCPLKPSRGLGKLGQRDDLVESWQADLRWPSRMLQQLVSV